MTTFGWAILGIWLLIIVFIWAVYNSLITLKTRAQEAWADIDTQLKRRYDLIPNLVETVKGYAHHEKELFEKVTQARASAMQAHGGGDLGEIAKSEVALSASLRGIFAVAENYPDLKASQNFLQLQDELSDTENKIQAARRFYNGNVRDYNIKTKVFPSNMVAGIFGFQDMKFFELEDAGQREPVKVAF